MPKKTRREKISAQERKKEFLLRQFSPQITVQTSPQPLQKTVVSNPEQPGATVPIVSQSYFISDLRKSLILVVAVITLEIMLYFGTISR